MEQIKIINKLNEKFNGFTILKSIEVDILEDRKLDLKELDLAVCSIHYKFNLSKKQTKRILRAMENPYFNILGYTPYHRATHSAPRSIPILLMWKD